MDQTRTDESGQFWYRLNEKYGSGDLFWGQAEAFHPLTAEEISPINSDAPDKRIIVKIWEKTLSCFEGKTEVHFARISSGALYDAWGNRVDVCTLLFKIVKIMITIALNNKREKLPLVRDLRQTS